MYWMTMWNTGGRKRQHCDLDYDALSETMPKQTSLFHAEVHLEHVSDLRELVNVQTADLIHKAMADMAGIQVTQEGRKRAIEMVLAAMLDAMPARNYARYEKKVRAEELRQKVGNESLA